MRTIAIDLEARYAKDFSVRDFGSVNYLGHPEGDVYLMAAAGDDGFRWVGRPENLDWTQIKGSRTICHNASFDSAFFEVRPTLPKPREINCTAALAAYNGSGRALDVAAKKLLGRTISKDPRTSMRGRSWEDLSAHEQAELVRYCQTDAELSLQLWERYSGTWPAHEQRLSRQTISLGLYGVCVDTAKLEDSIAKVSELLVKFAAEIPWESPLQSVKKAAKHCESLGIRSPKSFAEDSEECMEWEKEFGNAHAFVRSLRDYRKSTIILRKLEAMKRRIMPNGRMNFDLKYFGAHTGRWTGGGGVNLQNLDKLPWNGIYLRSLLVPAPGKKFIVCDLSQIEPRVLAWLVGDESLLGALRKAFGVYEAMAITWGLWSGPAGTLKKTDPILYAFLKSMTLGAGYGLGAAKFRSKCAEIGIELSIEEAQRRIELFRTRNPLIVKKWREFDEALRRHLLKGEATLYLPSDRTLKYPNLKRRREPAKLIPDPTGGLPRIEPGKEYICATLPTEHGVRETRLWGGVIVENATQALARDIFADCLLRLERDGIRVVLHAHDEVLCEVDADVTENDIEELMIVPPSWAKALPLSAEAKEIPHYVK